MKRLTALLSVLALVGCNGDDSGGESDSGPVAQEVRTTKVEVVEGLGKKGSFDASALYDRLSPGVVTVISVFGDGAASILRGDDDGEAGQGSGFLIDGKGYIATNAHVVTTEAPNSKRAKKVYVELSDGNRVEAKIVGDDPNADVAVLKVDPGGLKLTPLELGLSLIHI